METRPATTLWDKFDQRLKNHVTPAAWQTWLEPLDPIMKNNTLQLEAPTDFHVRWVTDRYRQAIEETALEVFGEHIKIEFSTRESLIADHNTVDHNTVEVMPQPPTPIPVQDLESRLIARYTFDNFVVGQSNRFSYAAAMAVAEQPGSHYNPLFIYGDAGLGKTHLLNAVGHHRRELAPESIVRYISSEQFFNEFIDGIRRKRMDQFKSRYRTVDVLLLDDVQFFEGKEQILEEFFHTFNSLYEAGKQLVISADRPPKHLSTLEARLRSRFEWGLMTDIQPPDVETRLAILRKSADCMPAAVPREVLNLIAELVLDNIRELEGALTRVTAYAALTYSEITLPMAKEVLADLQPYVESTPLDASRIMTLAARAYNVSETDLIGPSRKQPLARSRQIAMYLCRELTGLSLPKIGARFGGRDHTTVIHAVEKVRQLMQTEKEVYDEVTHLSHQLRQT